MKTAMSRRAQRIVAEFYPYASKRALCTLKREAGVAVALAIKAGTLKKQPCVECGLSRVEAHHEDYAKPLDVMWLCRHHHRRRDAELRDERRETVARITNLPVAFMKAQADREARLSIKGNGTPRRTLMRTDCTVAIVRQATMEIAAAIDAEGISENVLARRMRVSRQVVNAQFAAGFRTLKVLSAYADALGYEARFVLRKSQRRAS